VKSIQNKIFGCISILNFNKNDDIKYKLEELVSFKSNDDGSFEIVQVDFTKDFKE
jgi:hypothetical protein